MLTAGKRRGPRALETHLRPRGDARLFSLPMAKQLPGEVTFSAWGEQLCFCFLLLYTFFIFFFLKNLKESFEMYLLKRVLDGRH